MSRLRPWAVVVPAVLAIAAPTLAASNQPPSKLWSQFPLGQTIPKKTETRPAEPKPRPPTAQAPHRPEAPNNPASDHTQTLVLVLAGVGAALVFLLLLVRQGSRAVILSPRLTIGKGARHMRMHRSRRAKTQPEGPAIAKVVGPPPDPATLADTLNPYSLRERIESVTEFSPDRGQQPAGETVSAGEGAASFAELGSRVAGVLEAAEAAAQKLYEDARAEAQRLREQTAQEIEGERARAVQLRQDAETYAAKIREEAERMADDQRQAAEKEATKIRSEAQAEARALRESGEQLQARIQADALDRNQQLEARSRELEGWLRTVLGNMRDAASQLEGALTKTTEPDEAERREMVGSRSE